MSEGENTDHREIGNQDIDFSDIRKMSLQSFSEENLISEDKLSDWKKSGVIYYISLSIFFLSIGSLTQLLFSDVSVYAIETLVVSGVLILSLIFSYFKRQEFLSEEISRSDLIYHKFAEMVELYFREDYGEMKTVIKSIDGWNDINFFFGGRTLPRDIIKGLRRYRKYLKKSEKNERVDEFVEESFESIITYPITYLRMTREKQFVVKVRDYKEESFRGKSWSKHFTTPINNVLSKITEFTVYEVSAVIIVGVGGILRYMGHDFVGYASLLISVIVLLFKD